MYIKYILFYKKNLFLVKFLVFSYTPLCIRYYNLYETQYTYDIYNSPATYCGDFQVARERERENFYRKINFNLKLCFTVIWV